jgi:uncharacterized membrane protein
VAEDVSREADGPISGRFQRGSLEFDRVLFFSDAVFAIALTLLIVDVGIPTVKDPTSASSMLTALEESGPHLFAFFLGFVLIARYWAAHHRFCAHLNSVDGPFIQLNLAYLALVAFLPFPTGLFGRYLDNPVSTGLFALVLAAVSGLEVVQFVHARRAAQFTRTLSLPAFRFGLITSAVPVLVMLLSIPIAFVVTRWAPMFWLLIFPVEVLLERARPADLQRGQVP